MSSMSDDLAARLDTLSAEVATLRRKRRRSRLLVIGGAAVTVALVGGAVAVAVIPDPGSGVIHGCYDNSTGALRVIDPSTGSCSGSETALDWNARGLNWRGSWNLTASYAVGDAVAFNGSSYIAVSASVRSRPPSSAWATLSSGTRQHGAWSASVTYYVGSVVTYLGSSYVATLTSKNHVPTDPAKWALVASKGDPGDPGDPGAPGAPGPGAVSVDSENDSTQHSAALNGVGVQISAVCGANGSGGATFEISGTGPFSVSGTYYSVGPATVTTSSGQVQAVSGIAERNDNGQSGTFEIDASSTVQVSAHLLVTSGGSVASLEAFLAGSTTTGCAVRAVGVPTG
jgi:hypothetical protein